MTGATALREAQEEIGLPRGAMEVIGDLPTYTTGTMFIVTPVIALVQPDYRLVLNAFEVADAFEVPLDFLLDEANHIASVGEWRGRERRYIEIGWEDRRIWGATAAMIVNLSRRLRWQG